MSAKSIAIAATALAVPMLVAAPSQAKTAFQYWAQGQGVYVSSKDHPPGGIQSYLTGAPYGYGYPPPPPYGYGYAPPPPPPGYGYGYPDY